MNFRPWITGAAQPKLTQDRLLAISIAVPPVEEQMAIVTAAELRCQPLNGALARLTREVELLREYRTRLVADVVIGKLDVREAAAQLSEDATADIESEPSDESEDPELIEEEATEA